MKTCEIDGTWEDERGGEHYWHCEEPAVIEAELPDGQHNLHKYWICAGHAEEFGVAHA